MDQLGLWGPRVDDEEEPILLFLTYDIHIICALLHKIGIFDEQNDDDGPWKHDLATGQASCGFVLGMEYTNTAK